VIAEERRLLYVAMTRAKKRLFLTRAEHYEGGRRWRESRFLAEVLASGSRTVTDRVVESVATPAPVPSPNGSRAGVELSYSGIATYLECPRQYWYRYEERLPVVQSAEAVHGVVLHEVLRRAGEARKEGKRVTAALLRSFHTDVWRTTPFPDERRAPTFKRNGLVELEAYRKAGGFNDAPVYLEHPFNVAVDGWTLRGVIDRIDRVESGWRIIDFKSGRPVARRRRDLQLALYALGAATALRLDPLQAEVVYLASGESVMVEKMDGLLSDARRETEAVVEGIKSGRFEARPERRRCRLCPYRLACADAL
jgi:RecB family exonuclease